MKTRTESAVSDADFLKSLQKVTDPVAALRMILENESFLGFDSYYADLRQGLLDMARRVADAQPASDAQRWQAFLAHSFTQPAGKASAYAPAAATREEHDRIVNGWIDEVAASSAKKKEHALG